MSFQTRYFYAIIIIGLPVVKPKYNSVFWIVSDAKTQEAEWITQKVMYLSFLNYGSSHLSLRDLRVGHFRLEISDKQTEKQKNIIAWSY